MREMMVGPGQRVDILNHFDGRWVPGFEVIANSDGGVMVRRISDGVVLPVSFAATEIRPTY